MVYDSLFPGLPWDYTACPTPHRLDVCPEGAVGNQTPSLCLCSQIPTRPSYPGSCVDHTVPKFKINPFHYLSALFLKGWLEEAKGMYLSEAGTSNNQIGKMT